MASETECELIESDNQKQLAIETHSQQAGEFAESYEVMSKDPYETCFTYSRLRLESFLSRYLPQRGDGLSLLDVGCGTGNYLEVLRKRGYSVAGVDGSEEMLERARTNNPDVELKLSDVERLPFESERFDIVICIEVLRYLPNIDATVREMARVLKPGGMALVTAAPIFNLNGYFVINRMATALPMGNLVRLKQFFTTSGRLRRSFEGAGFARPTIHGVYVGPLNWVERLSQSSLPGFLRKWEKIDTKLADKPGLREFANMFLVVARKE